MEQRKEIVLYLFPLIKSFITAKTWIELSGEGLHCLELVLQVSYIIHMLCPQALYSYLYEIVFFK